MTKWIVAAVGLLALLLFSLSGEETVRVQTRVAENGPLTVTVQEQGRTRARLPFTVSAPVNAHMRRTTWLEGQRVEAGQALATLALLTEDTRTEASYQANLAAAIARRNAAAASLAEAESSLERAEREAQRRERLFLDRMIGEEERDAYLQVQEAARSRLLSAQSALRAAEADETSARARLMGTETDSSDSSAIVVTAPASGTIQQIYERGDRVVTAGTPLFQISNDDALELVVDLLTQDAVRVTPGASIQVSGWGGEQVLSAVVDYVEPLAFTKYSALGVEEQRVNVIASLVEDNHPLGAGYRIEAAIVVWQHDNVLKVPTSALFRRDGRWHVFAVMNDTAVLREVAVGERSRDDAQVLDGLSAGDEVIIFPSDLVQDGVAIQRL
ncbi:efflux RND transporter periplasmic adaptor subunit [Pseudohongiella spirulinae]|uniref:Efflux transporter, RND family, MFP subunit n=1 Tax=Pseudohongiella spirulinae TaxID=1249552 RepID=A0A0S2KGH2_9GAMM|nr:efflux RND transporter periplasmic adaptor subunit [Pseudohongiella spirulinae]ALO47219.1 Efflux transporter, RND family, MFP subunit [Pseudohongiella spirulinae]